MDSASLIQFLSSGVTEGARYALAALGFTLIYNASGVINFAQGESIMIGGLAVAIMSASGVPLVLAIPVALLAAVLISLILQVLAVATLRRSGILTVIIMTAAFGLVLRGIVQAFWGTGTHTFPPFTGSEPLRFAGGTILPQTLWVIGVTAVLLLLMMFFFRYTRAGRAFLATAADSSTASLMGINVRRVLMLAFGLGGLIGAVAGVVTTPITTTSYDAGVLLGVKAIIAAILGGTGSVLGAVIAGLLLGLTEALTAGYISSAYKDTVPFAMVVCVLVLRPNGLLGKAPMERV
jgi:branched-chain amino acid transport system permease protein